MMKAGLGLSALLLAVASPVAKADLLLQYTFDEPSGNALDTGTAPASDGVLTGGAVRSSNTPGGTGSSIDLTDDAATFRHVLSGDAAKLDGLSAFTLTTWLNVSSYPSGNNRLVAKQAGGAFGGFSWNMNATVVDGTVGADNFRMALFVGNNVSSGAADFGSASSTVDVEKPANSWAFLAVSYDGTTSTNNVKYYIGDANGNVTQLGAAVSTVGVTVDAGTARFGVGFTDAAPTADTSVIGLQDDVRVYNQVLTLEDLEAIRLSAIPEPTSVAALTLAGAGLLARRRRG